MPHQITFDPVSNGKDADEYEAIQCYNKEHGLAQIVRIPGINDDQWEKLSAKFLLDHSDE